MIVRPAKVAIVAAVAATNTSKAKNATAAQTSLALRKALDEHSVSVMLAAARSGPSLNIDLDVDFVIDTNESIRM